MKMESSLKSSFFRVKFKSLANKEEKPCHNRMKLKKVDDKRFSRKAIPSDLRLMFSKKKTSNSSTIIRNTSSNHPMTYIKVEDLQPAKKNMKQDHRTKSFSSQCQKRYILQPMQRNVSKVQELPDEEVAIPEVEPYTRAASLNTKSMPSHSSIITKNDYKQYATVLNRDPVTFLLQGNDQLKTFQLFSVSEGGKAGADNYSMSMYDQLAPLRNTVYGNLEQIRIIREAKLNSIACTRYQLAREEEELSKINAS